MTTRRSFVSALAAGALTTPGGSRAQIRNKRMPRVAVVFITLPAAEMSGPEPASANARMIVHALRDVGLVDGRDIVIERRSAEGRGERLPALMQEVVALDVDVIVTIGPGVPAAQRATDRIPIVGLVEDALDAGMVDSLARPGRNLTGFGGNFPGFTGKQLQLLKEAASAISRVAVLASSELPGPRASWRADIEAAARSMQIELLWAAVDAPEQYEPALATIARERADALFVANNALNYGQRLRIADFAVRQRLPSFCGFRDYVAAVAWCHTVPTWSTPTATRLAT